MALIALSVVAIVLQSFQALAVRYASAFAIFEAVTVAQLRELVSGVAPSYYPARDCKRVFWLTDIF